jgi:hypothetical protein
MTTDTKIAGTITTANLGDGPRPDLFSPIVGDKPAYETCSECGAEVTIRETVPAVDSDEWDEIQADHDPTCPWAQTRAGMAITAITGYVTAANLGDDPRPDLYLQVVREQLGAAYPTASIEVTLRDDETQEDIQAWIGDERTHEVDFDGRSALNDAIWTAYLEHPDHMA